MAWPHVFGAESGDVAASQLDDNFNAAAFAVDLTALGATVAGLPSNTTPLASTAGGAAGVAAGLSRDDHQHPPQPGTANIIATTSYTVAATDNGLVLQFTAGTAVTVTVPNSLAADFNCLATQMGAGQVTFTAGSGATQHQRSGLSKTAGQYAIVTILGTGNAGSAFVYTLSGDMA